jgi:hypothetical protein
MAEIGEGMPKPWDRETCRRRYVEGTGIGLRGLSKLSGVQFGKLTEWSRKDKLDPENRTWPKQREHYQAEIRSKSQQKSTEAISDKYAQQNAIAIEQHIDLSTRQRDLAGVFLSALSTKVNKVTNPDKVSEQALKKANAIVAIFHDVGGKVPLQVCANILGQAVGLERQARYMDLADPAVLEKAAARHGLSLVDLEAIQGDNE